MSSPDLKFEDVLQPLIKDGFIIYCGAGISIPAPSCAPSWWTLTEEILESFFARIPDGWGLPKDLIIYDPDRQPEVIFENFANMLDLRLYEIFKVLDLSEPNENHRIIAKLAKAGVLKACITTNFDIFIERALKEEGVNYVLLVDNPEYENFTTQKSNSEKFVLCKIHGTISKPTSIVSVASAYKSSKGFSIPKATLISFLLKTYPVLFLGYSGWDFEHLNYRRFWDRVGPQCKGIYWNKRPAETGGPKLDEIFSNSLHLFKVCRGELPADFLSGFQQSGRVPGLKAKGVIYTKEASDEEFKNFKGKRIAYLKKWAVDIPESLACGLVISEANTFSAQFKERKKELHAQVEELDTLSFGSTNWASELAQKLSKQEITMEQYQREVQKNMLQLRMSLIKKSMRPQIIEWIQKNQYPGVTDNQQKLDLWLGWLGAFTRDFDLKSASEESLRIMDRYSRCAGKPDPESQAEAAITLILPSIMHPKKVLWEPYYNKMLEEKNRFIKNEIDFKTFQGRVNELCLQSTNAKLGINIPMKTLYSGLVSVVGASKTVEELQQGCEALFLCMDAAAGWIYSDLINDKEIQPTYHSIVKSIAETHTVELPVIETFDNHIRALFQPIITKLKEFDKLSIPRLLLEASILKVWNEILPNIDTHEVQKYRPIWDEGKYPLRLTNAALYSYVRKQIDDWLPTALKKFPPRFLQKLLGVLTTVAEGGNAFDWLKEISLKSLELTEGVVTEATPINIPGSLAGAYEMKGDQGNALKYYTLALDAIKSAIPPNWQDAIVYRAALLTSQHHSPESQKSALKIIAQYHPAFHGNEAIVKAPARQHCKDLAETIAHNLGYSNANIAVKTLFP